MDKNLDVYSFDDLLVACAQDVIQNGFSSGTLPSTIRDWLCGKIIETLPDKLIQSLLLLIIESKDATEKIGFRERKKPDYNEFAIVLYKSELVKHKHEAEYFKSPEKYLEGQDKYAIFASKNDTNLELNQNKFSCDDIIIQPDQIVPKYSNYNVSHKIESSVVQKSKAVKSQKEIEEELSKLINSGDETGNKQNELDNDDEDEVSSTDSEDYKPKNKKKKKAKSGEKRTWERNTLKPFKCKFCERSYNRNSELTKHYKDRHHDYWLQICDPVTGRKYHARRWRGDMFDPVVKCPLCPREACNIGQLRQHYKTKHLDYFHGELELIGTDKTRDPVHKCVVCEQVFWTNEEVLEHQAESHPKFDERRRATAEARSWKCKECDKTFTTEKGYKQHIMAIHNKIYPFWCTVCNKGFRSSYRYRQVHQKKNHPDLYEQWIREKAANGGKNPDVRTDQTEYGTPKTGKLYGAKIKGRTDLPPVKVYQGGELVDYYEQQNLANAT